MSVEKTWRPYFIVTQRFIKERSVEYLCDRSGIGKRMYQQEQAQAIKTLVAIVRDREAALLPSEGEDKVPETSQVLAVKAPETSPALAEVTVADRMKPFLRPDLKIERWSRPFLQNRRFFMGGAATIIFMLVVLNVVIWRPFLGPINTSPEATATLTNMTPIPAPAQAILCQGSEQQDALRVVIAEFKRAETAPDLLLTERLFDHLAGRLAGRVTICKLEQTVSNQAEAGQVGRENGADIVIWGRVDIAALEIGLKAIGGEWPAPHLSAHPLKEALDFTFQIEHEPSYISFLTEFTLSEVLYLEQRYEEAREILDRTLAMAWENKIERAKPADMARAYFLLDFLYDELDH